MLTIMFMFFRDSATGEPAFSEVSTGGARRRTLMLVGVGS